MTLADEIEERWSRARVSDDGAVTVPGCEDPRADVRALLTALRGESKRALLEELRATPPEQPTIVGAKRRRKRGEQA